MDRRSGQGGGSGQVVGWQAGGGGRRDGSVRLPEPGGAGVAGMDGGRRERRREQGAGAAGELPQGPRPAYRGGTRLQQERYHRVGDQGHEIALSGHPVMVAAAPGAPPLFCQNGLAPPPSRRRDPGCPNSTSTTSASATRPRWASSMPWPTSI